MSKVVDSRVVEMRFDNAQFERNVKTTMSTLDKLKEKLKFSGASKGLDDIEKSAKQVDMSGLGRGVDTIKNEILRHGSYSHDCSFKHYYNCNESWKEYC